MNNPTDIHGRKFLPGTRVLWDRSAGGGRPRLAPTLSPRGDVSAAAWKDTQPTGHGCSGNLLYALWSVTTTYGSALSIQRRPASHRAHCSQVVRSCPEDSQTAHTGRTDRQPVSSPARAHPYSPACPSPAGGPRRAATLLCGEEGRSPRPTVAFRVVPVGGPGTSPCFPHPLYRLPFPRAGGPRRAATLSSAPHCGPAYPHPPCGSRAASYP